MPLENPFIPYNLLVKKIEAIYLSRSPDLIYYNKDIYI